MKGCFIDPRSGREMRHHVLESGLLKAVKRGIQVAGIDKKAGCYTLRQSFAAHMPVNGVNIRAFRHETENRIIFTKKPHKKAA